MALKLSILIATMPARRMQFLKLIAKVGLQIPDIELVEILHDDRMDISIGTKRNLLLEEARGEYVVFIDDDDDVSDDYVSAILDATKTSPDCIGISGYITHDGGHPVPWHISKNYKTWFYRNGVYYRTPNHISPIKRVIALQAGFPSGSVFGEDAEFSKRVLPFLKSEIIIYQPLYLYAYVSKK